ncbi:MAG: hypothetical protein COB37_02185 [Kordiimonadales bacterium]|nr:MAG: hypothetical protein COB37_02185 [Kordiimonadales bacterium]
MLYPTELRDHTLAQRKWFTGNAEVRQRASTQAMLTQRRLRLVDTDNSKLLYGSLVFCLTVRMRIGPTILGMTLAALCLASPGRAAESEHGTTVKKQLKACTSGLVTEISGGDQLVLETGIIVKLADVKAPEHWPEDGPFRSWPYAAQSKETLATLTLGRHIELFCTPTPFDYLNRVIAHVFLADGSWLQELLLLDGAVMGFPSSKSIEISTLVYQFESVAQYSNAGLWKTQGMRPVWERDGNLRPGWFQIIRGKVLAAKKLKAKSFLNFGVDRNTDFTVEIPRSLYRQLKGQGADPLSFEGNWIEARGWVEWAGGPKIILTNANHIRVIKAPASDTD